MSDEIEKLKKERDAAIEAGLKLACIVREKIDRDSSNPKTIMATHEAIAAIEALRTKPERLRGWAVVYPDGSFIGFESQEAAESYVVAGHGTAVPIIQSKPLPELPEMEEWEVVGSLGAIDAKAASKLNVFARDFPEAKEFVRLHNAAVRAFKAWAETVKKEVGDE